MIIDVIPLKQLLIENHAEVEPVVVNSEIFPIGQLQTLVDIKVKPDSKLEIDRNLASIKQKVEHVSLSNLLRWTSFKRVNFDERIVSKLPYFSEQRWRASLCSKSKPTFSATRELAKRFGI